MKCILSLQYFQLTMGLSKCYPIVRKEYLYTDTRLFCDRLMRAVGQPHFVGVSRVPCVGNGHCHCQFCWGEVCLGVGCEDIGIRPQTLLSGVSLARMLRHF